MGLPNLSLVEGGFEELAQELALYLDSLRGEGSSVASEIAPLLAKPEGEEGPKETDRDAVLKKIVTAASALNKAQYAILAVREKAKRSGHGSSGRTKTQSRYEYR